jgi:hypothetical protein
MKCRRMTTDRHLEGRVSQVNKAGRIEVPVRWYHMQGAPLRILRISVRGVHGAG